MMTKDRSEIVIEGRREGVEWLAHEFKWKPGDRNTRAGLVCAASTRLDWQMWLPLGSPAAKSVAYRAYCQDC